MANSTLKTDNCSFRYCQRTLKDEISCVGIGLHTGIKVSMKLKPAAPDTGIVFHRVDIAGKGAVIPAKWDNVVDATLCSSIGNDEGVKIMTIEHLMAAFHSMGIDNAEVEINGSEVPAMDGSAAQFVFLIECAGIAKQNAPRKAIKVLKEISITDGDCIVSITPAEKGLSIDFDINFNADAIGYQSYYVELDKESFKSNISRARTFGFLKDVEKLRAAGLARGGSLENAVVIDENTILNKDGLRYKDEFVRHKILDAVGDLYLAGHSIIGNYCGSRSGHAHTSQLLNKMFNDKSSWKLVNLDDYTPSSKKWKEPIKAFA